MAIVDCYWFLFNLLDGIQEQVNEMPIAKRIKYTIMIAEVKL